MTEELQDYTLADMMLELNDLGFGTQFMRTVLAATQKMYGGRRKYEAAFQVVEGLARGCPVAQAAPMPREVLCALVVLATAIGKPGVGMVLLLSCCGLLRASEALRLRWCDVLLPQEHRSGAFVALLLGATKRGTADSTKVVIDNATTVAFIEKFAATRSAEHRLGYFCGTTYAQVRYWLHKLLPALGFAKDSSRSHSCRRGGASALSLAGLSLQGVMIAGRWKSEASCRLYLRKAEVALTRFTANVSAAQWRLVGRIGRVGVHVLEVLTEDSDSDDGEK